MNIKAKIQKHFSSQKLLDSQAELAEYVQDHSFVQGELPSLIVKPKKASEIKEIIILANREEFGLIPVSSGLPRFRGDTVPLKKELVIVDMQDMKKIEWVNRRNRVAVIEPGVTFSELVPALAKEGLRPLMPLSPKSRKSVLTCYWEREPLTLTRFQWEAMDPITTTEFILGNGEVLYAGEVGSLTGSKEKQRKRGHSHKHPFGILSMNVKKLGGGSQGTLGICPWVAIRCELLPEYEKMYCIYGDSLEELTEAGHRLVYNRLADDLFILNSLNLACLLAKEFNEIRAIQESLPKWILLFTISGYGILPQKMIEYKQTELKKLGFKFKEDLNGIGNERLKNLVRRVSEEPYWKLRLKGDVRELFFQTSLRKSSHFVKLMEQIINRMGFLSSDLGIYIQPQLQGVYCHLEFDFYFPAGNEGEAEKVKNLLRTSALEMFSQGAFFSRPYGEIANMVYSRYSQTVKLLKIIKEMFDPKGIMSPGRFPF